MGGVAEKNARELLFAPVVGEREVLSLSFTEKVDFQRRFRIGVIHRHRVHKSELALPECDAPIHPSEVTCDSHRIHISGEIVGEGKAL